MSTRIQSYCALISKKCYQGIVSVRTASFLHLSKRVCGLDSSLGSLPDQPGVDKKGVPMQLLGMKGGEPTGGWEASGALGAPSIYLGVWAGPVKKQAAELAV